MDGLVPLTAAPAADPGIVGHKAAGLARAAATGLPVLPGWVLPLHESGAAIAAGAEVLERSGRAAAVIATSRRDLGPRVERALAQVGDALGGSAAVRSSTERDGDGRWAGAFASYLDVEKGLLPVAVRGSWSSVFSRDVLARCAQAGEAVGTLRVATLMQPWVGFEAGGVARCGPDGSVSVTAAAGSPAGVVGGRASGVTFDVSPDGQLRANGAGPDVGAAVVLAAASLARATSQATGEETVEWGWARGAVTLLQATTSGRSVQRPRDVPAPGPWASPHAETMAWIMARYPGLLGDELVAPWALASRVVPDEEVVRVDDPVAALEEARSLAATLASDVWGLPAGAAQKAAAAATRQLLGSQPEQGLAATEGLCPPDARRATRLLGLIAGLRDLSPATARDRWMPFVFQVVRARGQESRGLPSAPGIGVGLAHAVRSLRSMSVPGIRSIVVAAEPLPQLAPLLWHASGVVTGAGSPGAHLFEVARSLGIPAVSGVDMVLREGSLVAVDGDDGAVSVLTAPAEGVGGR